MSLFKDFRDRNLGFHIDEVMSGEHRFEPGFGDGGARPMEFRGTWGTQNLADWLSPKSGDFLKSSFEGTVSIDGLCVDAPCKGFLELRYFDEKRVRYSFDFSAGGKKYHYVGEKVNIRPWNLLVSHTTCFGHLTEAGTGKLVSTSVTFFKLSKALGFLLSLRLTHA